MQPTKDTELLARLVEIIVNRYHDIESSLPLLNRELSHLERKTVKIVGAKTRVTIGSIGVALDIAPSSATWVIKNLVERKILKRERDKTDRRKVWIELANKGEALAGLMERIADRIGADLLYKLSQEKRTEFSNISREILSRIEESG